MSRKALLVTTSAIVVLSLVPLPYLASPEWHIQVIDESGKPLQGMLARLSYANYSVEATGHEEDRYTDEHGEAVFQSHTRWAPILQRCIFTTLSAAALEHASFGPHAFIFAFGKGLEGDAVSGGIVIDWTGRPAQMASRIIAKQVPE